MPNLKTASTSIERVLSARADIRLIQSQFGKHHRFSEFNGCFKWLLSCVKMHGLFVFEVMRDPANYVLSMYNSHRIERFRTTPKLYTGDMDFGRSVAEWTPRSADQLYPQFA